MLRFEFVFFQLDRRETPNSDKTSDLLIIWVHGGGFVSQTTVSHEGYLKEIAVELDAPILSIDYSLIPFPRALEEIFYTYCWALENTEFLGSTGKKIIMMGDSAGSNLACGCIIKCIEAGIRIPDQLVNFYGFFYVEFSVSPSRLVSVMDPFLPPKIISNILNSYLTGETNVCKTRDASKEIRTGNCLVSPFLASPKILEKFPPTNFYTSNFDASLDDNVEFAKKLKAVKVKVNLKVLRDIPHAFLSYIGVSISSVSIFDLNIQPKISLEFKGLS